MEKRKSSPAGRQPCGGNVDTVENVDNPVGRGPAGGKARKIRGKPERKKSVKNRHIHSFLLLASGRKTVDMWKRSDAEQAFPDFVDIPRSHSYQQISGCAIFQ